MSAQKVEGFKLGRMNDESREWCNLDKIHPQECRRKCGQRK